jgi:hypothetical protein
MLRKFLAISLLLSPLAAERAAAVQVTLNLVPSQSFVSLDGNYATNQFYPQDDPDFPTPDVTDGDLSNPSNRTTLSGTITVEVDNVMAPTTIQIVSSNMDAAITGSWLPDFQPEAGAESMGTVPQPAQPADIAIKIVADFGVPMCCDIAYAVLRDVNYNLATLDLEDLAQDIITPVSEPVNAQGEFSSLSTVLSYNTGFFEYWADPFLLNDRQRDNVSGDGAPNQHTVDQTTNPDTVTPIENAPKSTYVVSGGIATLTIPIDINVIDDLTQLVDGQFVATFEIPAGLDGDYNQDGTVDMADYVAWRKDPSSFGGDPDGYDAWRQNFGASQAGAGAAAGVPEPATAVLLLLSSLVFLKRR